MGDCLYGLGTGGEEGRGYGMNDVTVIGNTGEVW